MKRVRFRSLSNGYLGRSYMHDGSWLLCCDGRDMRTGSAKTNFQASGARAKFLATPPSIASHDDPC